VSGNKVQKRGKSKRELVKQVIRPIGNNKKKMVPMDIGGKMFWKAAFGRPRIR
jgi:hypothetical protein